MRIMISCITGNVHIEYRSEDPGCEVVRGFDAVGGLCCAAAASMLPA